MINSGWRLAGVFSLTESTAACVSTNPPSQPPLPPQKRNETNSQDLSLDS